MSLLDKNFKDEIISVLNKQKSNPQMQGADYSKIRTKIREIVDEFRESQNQSMNGW